MTYKWKQPRYIQTDRLLGFRIPFTSRYIYIGTTDQFYGTFNVSKYKREFNKIKEAELRREFLEHIKENELPNLYRINSETKDIKKL